MLKVTATMGADVRLQDVATHAKRVESLGYDMLSVPEAVHDGMLTSFAALSATTKLNVGTGVLVAFARSPMLAAQGAWDLAEMSGGRFQLGLGTQVKGILLGVSACLGARPLRVFAIMWRRFARALTRFRTGRRSISRVSRIR